MRIRALFTAAASAVAIATSLAMPAQAVTGKTAASQHLIRQITVPMKLNCTKMTAKVHAYAVKHGYCPSIAPGAVSPKNTVWGDCGYSSFKMYDAGEQRVHWYAHAYSSKGSIADTAWSVDLDNWTTSLPGHQDGVDWPFDANWYHDDSIYMGYGVIHGKLTGTVTLTWLGTCDLLGPEDLIGI